MMNLETLKAELEDGTMGLIEISPKKNPLDLIGKRQMIFYIDANGDEIPMIGIVKKLWVMY